MNCLWSILILTMPARAAMLARLLGVLEPQITEGDGIELLIRPYDPALPTAPNRTLERDAQGTWQPQATRPVGENRELMRQQARGAYISFIDDDDLVSPKYVERILPLLEPGDVDYIGFNLEQRLDGRITGTHYRSLRFRPPCPVPAGGLLGHYSDVSHLNPLRRELALRVPMSGWPADDVRWAEELRKLNIVHSEHYVDETLYYYLTRSRKPELSRVPSPESRDSQPDSVLLAEDCPWIYMTKIKVKMLTGVAGNANPVYDLPAHGYQPDEIVEVHPELAKFWFASGLAEPVKPQLPARVEPKEPKVAKAEETAAPAPVPAEPPAAKVVPIAKAETPDTPAPAETPAEPTAETVVAPSRRPSTRAAAKSAPDEAVKP